MIKDQLQKQLLKEVKPGIKPSQLKKSRSLNDLSLQAPKPSLTKSKSAEELKPANSQQLIEQLENKVSVLELELEIQKRELDELETLKAENKHLREQMKVKQQELEELRKQLEETTSELTQVKNELDDSLKARHQALKVFSSEHSKRVQREKELTNTENEASEELVNQDEQISQLKNQIINLTQTNQNLQKDLNLTQRLANLRKRDPYFEPSFNSSLVYFKYGVYALLAVWLALTLKNSFLKGKDEVIYNEPSFLRRNYD